MPVATQQEIRTRMAAAIAAAVGGDVREDGTVTVERDGVALTVAPFEGRRNIHSATISAPLPTAAERGGAYRSDGRPQVAGRPDLDLRARGGGDALGEQLGLDSPLVADETRFARAVVVECAAPREIVRQVLAAPAARAAVLGLLRGGCPTVKVHAAAGEVSTTVSVRGGSLPEAVEPLLPLMASLCSALPVFEHGGRTWRGGVIHWLGPLLGFITLVGGVLLALIGMLNWEPAGHTAFRLGASWGLPVGVVLAPLVYLLARGRPGGLLTFGLTVVPLLIGLPLLIAGGAITFNAKLDRSAPMTRNATVLRRETRSDRKGTRYLLHVSNWRPGQSEPEVIAVSADQHAAAKESGQVHLRLRAGRLGWPWLEGWELAPRR